MCDKVDPRFNEKLRNHQELDSSGSDLPPTQPMGPSFSTQEFQKTKKESRWYFE